MLVHSFEGNYGNPLFGFRTHAGAAATTTGDGGGATDSQVQHGEAGGLSVNQTQWLVSMILNNLGGDNTEGLNQRAFSRGHYVDLPDL